MRRTPAQVFHPGEFIKDEIDIRDWSETIFAMRANLPVDTVSKLIAGTEPVTPYIARKLAHVFETSMAFWLNLQKAYDSRPNRL